MGSHFDDVSTFSVSGGTLAELLWRWSPNRFGDDTLKDDNEIVLRYEGKIHDVLFPGKGSHNSSSMSAVPSRRRTRSVRRAYTNVEAMDINLFPNPLSAIHTMYLHSSEPSSLSFSSSPSPLFCSSFLPWICYDPANSVYGYGEASFLPRRPASTVYVPRMGLGIHSKALLQQTSHQSPAWFLPYPSPQSLPQETLPPQISVSGRCGRRSILRTDGRDIIRAFTVFFFFFFFFYNQVFFSQESLHFSFDLCICN